MKAWSRRRSATAALQQLIARTLAACSARVATSRMRRRADATPVHVPHARTRILLSSRAPTARSLARVASICMQ